MGFGCSLFWKPFNFSGCYSQTWTPTEAAEWHQRRPEEPAAPHADESPARPTKGQTLFTAIFQSSHVLWLPKPYDAWLKQVSSCGFFVSLHVLEECDGQRYCFHIWNFIKIMCVVLTANIAHSATVWYGCEAKNRQEEWIQSLKTKHCRVSKSP